MFKVASRVQKIEVFKKGWNFASCCCLLASLQIASWKNSFSWGKETAFFLLIFTIKLSSAALSYLNADSTLNLLEHFYWIKIFILFLLNCLNFMRSSIMACTPSPILIPSRLGHVKHFRKVFAEAGSEIVIVVILK